jgi:carbonic anhydrase/acetyltransferase-like protein (isoleucine patch superfamily)
VFVNHNSKTPAIAGSAWIAPTAVVSGNVTIGEDVRVLHGAVITADGDANVQVGDRCVIMEGAVLRSAGRFGLSVGEYCLIGPHAYLSGCSLARYCFIATGAVVFNGSTLGEACTVAIGAKVHINTAMPANTNVPMGFIAFGNPATIYSPQDAPLVHQAMKDPSFMEFVFGMPTAGKNRCEIMHSALERYTNVLAKHREDVVLTRE